MLSFFLLLDNPRQKMDGLILSWSKESARRLQSSICPDEDMRSNLVPGNVVRLD